jgi:hypothetical protein
MPHSSTSPAPAAARGDGSALPFVAGEIPRVVAPSPEVFRRTYLQPSRPVVLTGLTEGWLPPAEWTLERMAQRYGDARVVAADLAGGTLRDDPAQGVVFRHVRVREFVASLANPGSAAHYVMAPTWNLPATFQEDYRVPPYCVGAAHLRAKVWLGKGGTVTPMHRDVPHNLHVHLHGRKRWLLFPPGGAHLYPRGLFSGMPNFSEVDPEQPDYARHPRFREATAFATTVGRGETLFIPHGWWHHTRTLDDAVSMNFWWGGPLVQLVALASTTFKRVRGIRRAEWG